MDIDKFIAANQWAFGDVVPVSVERHQVQGKIYAIPQDTEVRMYLLQQGHAAEDRQVRGVHRQHARSKVDSGRDDHGPDCGELAKEVVDKGAAKIGQLHRPNAGPD